MPHVHVGPTLELKLTDSSPNTWHTMSHSKCAKCPRTMLVALKNVANSDCLGIRRKFDLVVRFREKIPTVKVILSSEI